MVGAEQEEVLMEGTVTKLEGRKEEDNSPEAISSVAELTRCILVEATDVRF